MKRFVMGMDGGGTKTHVMIYDMIDRKACLAEGGPSSHEFLPGGFDEASEVMDDLIEKAVNKAGIAREDICHAVLGLAGLDVASQYEEMGKRVDRMLSCPCEIYNDAFLPILGGSPEGFGIGAINGTGFSVAGLDRNGRRLQIGGFHEYSGDLGGGKWYTEQVITAIYGKMYKDGPETALERYISEALGLNADDAFMERMMELRENDLDRLRLACCRSLHRAADEGDSVSRRILGASAREYASIFRAMAGRLDFGEGRVTAVLTGSQFTRGSKFFLEELEEQAGERFLLLYFMDPPVFGAIAEAVRKIGVAFDREELYSMLRESIDG